MPGITRNVLETFFGCHHHKTTRPITPAHKFGQPAGETYVACLACGKHLHYDLTKMRVGKPIAAARPGRHEEISQGNHQSCPDMSTEAEKPLFTNSFLAWYK